MRRPFIDKTEICGQGAVDMQGNPQGLGNFRHGEMRRRKLCFSIRVARFCDAAAGRKTTDLPVERWVGCSS
jgi:hypothetical protein